jgi:hypothetical protein
VLEFVRFFFMHLSQTGPKGRVPAPLPMIPHAVKFTSMGRGYDSDDRGEA